MSEQQSVALMLKGARVTPEFRKALFSAANRAGVTPNEYAIIATAERLARHGGRFAGVFEPGDFPSAESHPANDAQPGNTEQVA